MADMTPILIKDLVEQTTAADTDYMVIGGADAKKIKWSTIWGLIRDKLGIGAATLTTNDKTVKGAINELNTKIIVENKTVQISAGADYSYVPYKSGYVLASAKGTTFSGVYVTGIADTGINYAIFFNTAGQQAASLTLNLLWIKIS